MGATKTLDDINTVLDEFSTQIGRVRDSPEAVDEAFRQCAIIVSASEAGLSLGGSPIMFVLGAAYGAITEDDFTGSMQRNKKEIKDKIVTLLGELQGAIDGLKAPIAFLQTSGAWLGIQTEINQARNWIGNEAELRGKWSGSAADSYFATRTLQGTAHDTVSANCDTMSGCLAAISDASWEFYSKVVADLIKFLSSFAAALGKIATGVAAPIGIGDAIDALVSVTELVAGYGLTLGGVLIAQRNEINKIESSIDNPKAFHMNKWPEVGGKGLDIDEPNDEKWAAR